MCREFALKFSLESWWQNLDGTISNILLYLDYEPEKDPLFIMNMCIYSKSWLKENLDFLMHAFFIELQLYLLFILLLVVNFNESI